MIRAVVLVQLVILRNVGVVLFEECLCGADGTLWVALSFFCFFPVFPLFYGAGGGNMLLDTLC